MQILENVIETPASAPGQQTRRDFPWPLPKARGKAIGLTPDDIERAIDRDACERAAELERAIRARLFAGWPQVRAWLAVAVQDAAIGCAYGVGILCRPMTRAEQAFWLECFFRKLPSASRVLNEAGQVTGALPPGWRDLVWW